MLVYGVLAYAKHSLPVQSVVILLRREADGPGMSGRAGYVVPDSPDGSVEMRYRVVRVWEKDPDEVLNGPLATLPLAPLADVSADELPGIVRRMEGRIEAEALPEDRGMLWTTTFLLLDLRYDPEFSRQRLIRSVSDERVLNVSVHFAGRTRGRTRGRRTVGGP